MKWIKKLFGVRDDSPKTENEKEKKRRKLFEAPDDEREQQYKRLCELLDGFVKSAEELKSSDPYMAGVNAGRAEMMKIWMNIYIK